MQAYKLANELGITFAELQSLPSGGQLRKQTMAISPLVQQRLREELADRQHSTPDSETSGLHLVEDVRPLSLDETPPDEPSGRAGQVRVWELGRELNKPAERISDVLRGQTGQRYGWSPNDAVPQELAEHVRAALSGESSSMQVRRASPPSLVRAARSQEELEEVRVQVFSDKPTPGERYLAEALRRLDGALAYVCTFLPNGGNSVEIDALVISPSHVAVIEVKDTMQHGMVTPALNGPWQVGDEELQGGKSSPAQQVLRQARVVGSSRKEVPALRSLPPVPGFVAVHGSVHFQFRPLHQVANTECFGFKSTDVVAAVKAYAERCRGTVTVGQVLALMELLDVSRPIRLTRQELGSLGFPEDRQAVQCLSDPPASAQVG